VWWVVGGVGFVLWGGGGGGAGAQKALHNVLLHFIHLHLLKKTPHYTNSLEHQLPCTVSHLFLNSL